MSTREVDKFGQTLIINQNYKLFQSGMLAQGRNSNFKLYIVDDGDDADDDDDDDDDDDEDDDDDDDYMGTTMTITYCNMG